MNAFFMESRFGWVCKAISMFLVVCAIMAIGIPQTGAYGASEEYRMKLFNQQYDDIDYARLQDFTRDVLHDYESGSQLQLDYNFYPIYDMDSVRYAFLIPLKNGNTYTGFVIMGAIDNYYEPLVISDDEPLLTEALVEHARYNEIIFNFPFGFVVKQGADMYEVGHDLSLKRVVIGEYQI
ncbi:MAG: hypothetical protein FH749_04770 [Firmicutes bacterium]|nr:hypothetical protein [Bacillota bacterium]